MLDRDAKLNARHQAIAFGINREWALVNVAQADDLIVIGAGQGDLATQVAAIARALARARGSLADLCHLRVFYRGDEVALHAALAAELAGRAMPALTLIPVPRPQPDGDALSIEAMAVLGAAGDRRIGEGSFARGVRKGRFVFTSAVRSDAAGLVAESAGVMAGLGEILGALGAGFGDVVRMNRWYHAAGTKDEWEPSARAVAACYAEPGPVATALSLPMSLPGNRAIQIELMAMLTPDGSTLPKHHSWPEGHWDWPIHLPYKHGLACDGLAFVGGQVSLDARADVIDPDQLDLQVARSMDNIEKVLNGLGPRYRLLHLGIYYEIASGDPAGLAALLAVRDQAPAVMVGFDYLSYPKMRVEIEAIAAVA